MFDKDNRDQQARNFVNKKIKRCIKCGVELNYKEKFTFNDGVCCKCKGVKPFDEARKPEDLYAARSRAAQELYNRYPEWQRLNELAEEKWGNEHPPVVHFTSLKSTKVVTGDNFSSEKINELIDKYDDGEEIHITQEELMSLLWEVLDYRKGSKSP